MRHAAPHRNEPNLTEEQLGDDVSRASCKSRRLSALFDAHSRWRFDQTFKRQRSLVAHRSEWYEDLPESITPEDVKLMFAVGHYLPITNP